MITYLAFAFGIIVGILISGIFVWRLSCSRNIGDLRLDSSDPDSLPYLFLEIHRNKRHLIKSGKYVITRVKEEDYIPQK